MKKAQVRLLCLLLTFSSCFSVFGLAPSEIVDSEILSEVRKNGGTLQKTYYKQDKLSLELLPDTTFAKKAMNIWPSSEGTPVFVAETLNVISKSELNSFSPESVTLEKASQVMRSISRMKGMQYYSNTNKKWQTLYKDAYCIKGPKDRSKVPDDTSGTADGKTLYIMQNDNSFGKTNYRLDYGQSDTEISIVYSNTTAMYVGPFKAVDVGNLYVYIVVTDCGDDFVVYMLTMSKFPAMDFMESKMNDSFSSRLNAIFTWFCKEFR